MDESRRKRNKTWVDQGYEFYNLSMTYVCIKICLICIQHTMKKKPVVV